MSNPQLRNILQGWHRSFQKNVPFFAFFSIFFKRTYCSFHSFTFLFKRMFCSFHFFTFFLKKRSIFSVFLRSFQKNVPFFFLIYISIYIYIYFYIYLKKERNVLKFFCKKTKRYILCVLFRSKKRTLRSFPFFSRVFGNL